MKNQQLKANPFPNVILGDWHDDIVKVDWDERYLCEVIRFCKMLLYRYGLDGFIILLSSTHTHRIKNEELTEVVYTYRNKSYHSVFDKEVTKDELYSYLAWLCETVKDTRLTEWFLMQSIKRTLTLRCGFKGNKKPPRIVYRYGHQNNKIAEFLDNRQFILDFQKEQVKQK